MGISTEAHFTSSKMIAVADAGEIIARCKEKGKRVGLCHGGFDVLHPGHMKHFESAKGLCDVLVVSVTSDRFVASRKGDGRPVFSDALRAYSIAMLQCVDYVVITDFAKGVEVIELLRPSFYIKGPDFIGKNTPGITSEREAIARVGGEMKYTTDVKLSTTEIISYIKNELDCREVLVVLDRDGTLIEHSTDFFGKQENWKSELKLLMPVVSMVAYLQTKFKVTAIVASNQAGVARGLYDCNRVEEIHRYMNGLLKEQGVNVACWKYSPDVDVAYALAMKGRIDFLPAFVKEKTLRKPGVGMVDEALRELGRKKEEFSSIMVLGDQKEDEGLAQHLNALFIDVKGKTFEEMKRMVGLLDILAK